MINKIIVFQFSDEKIFFLLKIKGKNVFIILYFDIVFFILILFNKL